MVKGGGMEKKKVVRCPKCGKEIEELIYYQEGVVQSYWVGLDKDGDIEYNKIEDIYDNSDGGVYCCPHCEAELFDDEDEARKFLLGKKAKFIWEE
jgi:DNA-directed RNA polymerase subunit RPC12/RpoP